MTRYTLIVGTKNWSSWSLRPYLALRAIGVPFAEEVVPLRQSSTTDEIRRHSPSGRVPLLKIEAGGREHTIWDSLAICETLAERHPEAGLWPEDPFVRAAARSYAAEMHSGFADLREQLPMEFVRRIPTPELREATREQIDRIIEAWLFAAGQYGGRDGFLFGRFSIADCMYAPVVSRFRTYGIALPPALQAYSDTVWSLPGMQDWAAAAKKEVEAGLAKLVVDPGRPRAGI